MRDDVVVVGGGVAGLTAALRLADRGLRIRLVERRAILGGRSYSYRAREAGHAVDNGQHLLMGCYTRTLAFLDRIGAADRVEVQPQLEVPFIHPRRGTAVFRCASLPSPMHLTAAALGYRHLSPAERIGLLSGALRLLRRHLFRNGERLAGKTVATALSELGQGANARSSFWDPLAIAVMNDLPERASASLFAEVLRRIFFAPAAASRIVFPRVGLSDLYVEPAVRAIERAGATVEPGCAARTVEIADGRATAVCLADGRRLEAGSVVVAVPPPALADLLSEEAKARPGWTRLSRLEAAPIVSVHLWYRERFDAPRMAGFLESPIHWLFTPPMQPAEGRYVTLVTSGAYDLVERDPEDIVTMARAELARFLPATGSLEPVDALPTKERAATWAATPAEQRERAATKTPIANLFLAGDWTATGIPATIEGAVESGERAAAAVAG